MRNNKFLYLITLTFFALGLINIHFSLLGFICMTVPMILLVKDKKRPGAKDIAPELIYILR